MTDETQNLRQQEEAKAQERETLRSLAESYQESCKELQSQVKELNEALLSSQEQIRQTESTYQAQIEAFEKREVSRLQEHLERTNKYQLSQQCLEEQFESLQSELQAVQEISAQHSRAEQRILRREQELRQITDLLHTREEQLIQLREGGDAAKQLSLALREQLNTAQRQLDILQTERDEAKASLASLVRQNEDQKQEFEREKTAIVMSLLNQQFSTHRSPRAPS